MRTNVLGLMLFFVGLSYGQMPYQFKQEDERNCLAVYLIDQQPTYTHYLRLFEDDYESIVYFKKSDTLCEITRYAYEKGKQFYHSGDVIELKRIYKQDSLTFLKETNGELLYLSPIEFQAFHIEKVFELLKMPTKNGVFYESQVHAFLKINPKTKPILSNTLVLPWYIDPILKINLISKPCTQSNNLSCLCAALQFGSINQKQTAQQIATYLIERFRYGFGDTSQYNPTGLLMSDQNLAVCSGYSQMNEYILKKVNIDAKYVSGAVRVELNDIFYSGHSHAWNELELDGNRLCSDITWAQDSASNWLFNSEANFFLTHFREPTGDSIWDKNNHHTMYEFMHQPMVRNPERNASEQLPYLKNQLPMQFSKDKFTVAFTKPMHITGVHFYDLTYPFVNFESEKSEATGIQLSEGTEANYELSTDQVSINLKDQFTRIAMHVEGIGILDYCIFNGTEKEFYQFLIEHIDAKSAYSVAMAFMACAKLEDVTFFNKLKPYLENPKMSFSTFKKQAKSNNVDDYQFALFNATRHYGDFGGFSFEYSNNNNSPRIYLDISDDDQYYSFSGFNNDIWKLRKK